MTPIIERDSINRRTVSMWDECGMRFRSNVVEAGGRIELHTHSYAHVAAVWGPFRMTVGDQVSEISRGNVTIPAGVAHAFDYLGADVGQVLCFWPIGADA